MLFFRTLQVLSHGSRPYPGVVGLPRLRERERFSSPGADALQSYGALLEQVYHMVEFLSSVLAWGADFPAHAPHKERFSSPACMTGAFKRSHL